METCPHRPPCPGCPRFGEPGIAPAAAARLAALGPVTALHQGALFGFRHRARLMVRGRAKLGLFREGTHSIVDIPRCRIHHPLVNQVAAAARDAIRATRTPTYADRPHRGVVRALQVVVERASGTAQVVIVATEETPSLARALAERLGASLHSLWWNGNPERSNAILGPHWIPLLGPEAVRERIGGADVFFPPGAFGQSHLALADRLVERVHALVPDGARVAELYAGCGAIGLGLVGRAAHVAFNESDPHALRGLALGLEARRGSTSVAAGPAAQRLEALAGADVVIVDPPRRGLDPEVVDALRARRPQHLIYVSCDLDSLERDVARLGLRPAALEAWNLFPFTEHVEALAVFEASRA